MVRRDLPSVRLVYQLRVAGQEDELGRQAVLGCLCWYLYMHPYCERVLLDIALNVAARRRGIPVVLVMHGASLWPLPRLEYDLAIVNNLAAAADGSPSTPRRRLRGARRLGTARRDARRLRPGPWPWLR